MGAIRSALALSIWIVLWMERYVNAVVTGVCTGFRNFDLVSASGESVWMVARSRWSYNNRPCVARDLQGPLSTFWLRDFELASRALRLSACSKAYFPAPHRRPAHHRDRDR